MITYPSFLIQTLPPLPERKIKQKLEPYAKLVKSPLAILAGALDLWISSNVLHEAEIIHNHVRLLTWESDPRDTPGGNESTFRSIFLQGFDEASRDGAGDEIKMYVRAMVTTDCNSHPFMWKDYSELYVPL